MDDDSAIVTKLVELLKIVLNPASTCNSRVDAQLVIPITYLYT